MRISIRYGVHTQRKTRRTMNFPLHVVIVESEVQHRTIAAPTELTEMIVFRAMNMPARGRIRVMSRRDFEWLYRFAGPLHAKITRYETIGGKKGASA